jgi:hypothetical protein
MPDFIKVDIEKYRKDRQLDNINLVFEHIYKAQKQIESSDSININALQRVYDYIGSEVVIQKAQTDEAFAKLLSLYCCKSSSRQGSNDESYILETLKKFMASIGMKFEKSNINSLIPIKSGQFAGKLLHRDEVNKHNISKTECLKSIDCLVIEDLTIIGYGTLKVCFGAGGHQDNVILETGDFVEWAINYGDKSKLYLVIIDSDHTKINQLKKKSEPHENIWVVDHYEFQVRFYDWYSKKIQRE